MLTKLSQWVTIWFCSLLHVFLSKSHDPRCSVKPKMCSLFDKIFRTIAYVITPHQVHLSQWQNIETVLWATVWISMNAGMTTSWWCQRCQGSLKSSYSAPRKIFMYIMDGVISCDKSDVMMSILVPNQYLFISAGSKPSLVMSRLPGSESSSPSKWNVRATEELSEVAQTMLKNTMPIVPSS